MFLEHFGLKINPFGVTADSRFLYFGPEHKEALSALYVSILEGRGLAALVAHAGMGKTTLLRFLGSRLQGKAAIAFLSHPYRNRVDLMRDVLKRLALPAEENEYQQMSRFQLYLRNLAKRQGRVVLLFDEAQALSIEALEQVRLLSNLRSSNMHPIDIVLAGQTEFQELLSRPRLEALRQRISITARLRPMPVEEVGRYIERRLFIAGRRQPLFTPEAIEACARISGGIPRNLNQLCYRAMALAWADDEGQVTARIVCEAGEELESDEAEDQARSDAAGAPAASEASPPRGELAEEAARQSEAASEPAAESAAAAGGSKSEGRRPVRKADSGSSGGGRESNPWRNLVH